MVSLRISGCQSPERLSQVREVLGHSADSLYLKGQSNQELYVELSREAADLSLQTLNLLPGVSAVILQDLYAGLPAPATFR